MVSTPNTLRRCLNQILGAVIISCILTVAGTTTSVYVLTERVNNLEEYIQDNRVCLGQSVCKPEFDSHVRYTARELAYMDRKLDVLHERSMRESHD